MTAAVLKAAAPPSEAPTEAPKKAPFSKRTLIAVGAALAVAAAGAGWIAVPKATVATDDAYLQADTSTVAPKVRGLVAEVLVAHNQPVRRGQPLVRIDSEEFDARRQSAAAELQNAEAAVLSAKASFTQLDAQERLAAANVAAAETAIRAADAQNQRAEADRARYDQLSSSGFVTRRDVERIRADAIGAAADADKSRAQFDVSRNQAAEIRAKRATLVANLAQAEAQVARAQAALDLARQDQGHTIVASPIDGVVGDRQVEPGDYVQPGTRLMTVAPLHALYVTANFKETQVARMTPGQPATIRIDALPGVSLKGKVESFAPGTGSQFSLLPFEPGTGNFTKIVQRVPVRIRLLPNQPGLSRLRPGLSTTVKVRLAGQAG
jgi:membrane fusion protein (multidrug efflux system)